MSPSAPEVSALVHESRIKVPYSWAAGETLSRFLRSLRDTGKIEATRCPGCGTVYVPPRKACGRCFVDCAEWLEVGPRGTLVGFTRALYDSPAHPRPRPWFGLIRFDGAGTDLLHLLDEVGAEGPALGQRVEPVLAPSRSGSILDIAYFRPAR